MSLICPICQENLISKESPDNYVNKCGHVYHSNCILPWWDRTPEPTCPQCRDPCNIDTITKIYLTVDDTAMASGDGNRSTTSAIAMDDPKAEALLRQVKEHINLQTYNQTKDLNDKFRQLNSEFSTMLLNNITRLRSNYDDKLSAVSKELTTAISTAMDHERTDPESCNLADVHSKTKVRRQNKFLHPVAGITCLIAVITLIIVIVYSHLILDAIHSSATSLNIQNISQRLEVLNDELHQIANNSSRDNKNLRLAVDSVGKSVGNGAKTQDILKRLDDVSHRGDQLLLEQIQTDRRINLKLEVLENSINILKTRIEADKTPKSQTNFFDDRQSQLEEKNRELEAKLVHLKNILDKSSNATPEALRKEIENDSRLASETEDPKSIREEAVELWNKLINSGSSTSGGVEVSVKIVLIVASTLTTFLFQMN
ncbi:uncharacterized protein LOC119085829 [Bradysia coprophila]|uniref:uncharacterized protein LOC119085829 n=1 Tax=Bradysia coprophila TaxID=38358 RepID=UPI00187DB9F0|nr:uncharacterized protein LOC119085829 [Bradysia coprophila]